MLPQKLYKYREVNQYQLDALGRKAQWFALPSTFNDPFDCQLKLTSESQYFTSLPFYLNALGLTGRNITTVSSIIQSGKSQRKSDDQIIADIESVIFQQQTTNIRLELQNNLQSIQSQNANIGVLSLAEENDNLLLWAHYAHFHQGICLEFSTNETCPYSGVNVLSDASFTRKVKYGTHYPSLVDLKPYDSTHTELENNLLFFKSNEWEYEREWRTINSIGGQLLPFPGKLTGIIFGAKITDSDEDKILNVISNYSYKPDIYHAVIRDDKFALEIVKL